MNKIQNCNYLSSTTKQTNILGYRLQGKLIENESICYINFNYLPYSLYLLHIRIAIKSLDYLPYNLIKISIDITQTFNINNLNIHILQTIKIYNDTVGYGSYIISNLGQYLYNNNYKYEIVKNYKYDIVINNRNTFYWQIIIYNNKTKKSANNCNIL